MSTVNDTELARAVRLGHEQLLGIAACGPGARANACLELATNLAHLARDLVFRDSELETALVDSLFDAIQRMREALARA